MKVLVIHCTYKFKGGEDTVVSEEIKLLQSKGVTVELLTFDNSSSSGLKVLQLPFNMSAYKVARTTIAAFSPDVVHVHNLHYAASPSVVYAIKRSGVPAVMTLHNFRLLCPSATLYLKGRLYLESLEQSFPWKAIRDGAYRNSVPLTFWMSVCMQLHRWLGTWKIFDQYVALSQHAKHLFTQHGLKLPAGQLTIKPNFCTDAASTGYKEDYFLFVGRLSEEKGILSLLEAFASTSAKIKIAGDGPLRDLVSGYSERFPNIEFLGFRDKQEIFSLLTHCTALVFPSIWFEGMPLTIIEAFSCGTPVIASRLGAMENMITDQFNGLHFEPGSMSDMKQKLTSWQHMDEQEKTQYRNNARATYVQHYTPDKNYEQLMAIYTTAVESRNRVMNKSLRPAS